MNGKNLNVHELAVGFGSAAFTEGANFLRGVFIGLFCEFCWLMFKSGWMGVRVLVIV